LILCLFDSVDAPQENMRIPVTEHTDQVWHVFLPDVKLDNFTVTASTVRTIPSRGCAQQFQAAARSLCQSDSRRNQLGDEMFAYVVGDKLEDLTRDFSR